MRAEILAIGTELLVGSIVNTNAAYLASRLAEDAFDVYHHGTVGDNVGRIVEALETALRRSDLVVTCGGLGPTEDDVTASAVARAMGAGLGRHEPTYRAARRRVEPKRLRMTRLIARQCDIPIGSRALPNENGTAPGILASLERGGAKKYILALPGPPRELRPMYDNHARPLLKKLGLAGRGRFVVHSVRICGLIEAQVAQKVGKLLQSPPPLTVGIYAKPGEVELKVMAKHRSARTAQRMARGVERKIRRLFGDKVFAVGGETLEGVVSGLLSARKRTLSVAESCTGGSLSDLITSAPGSSRGFLGGIVSYSVLAKRKLLGVSSETLRRHGPVSAEVAKAMARGAARTFGSDFGLGVTGNAGPTTEDKREPVGAVYIGLWDGRRATARSYHFSGNRPEIKDRAAREALLWLRLALLAGQSLHS